MARVVAGLARQLKRDGEATQPSPYRLWDLARIKATNATKRVRHGCLTQRVALVARALCYDMRSITWTTRPFGCWTVPIKRPVVRCGSSFPVNARYRV